MKIFSKYRFTIFILFFTLFVLISFISAGQVYFKYLTKGDTVSFLDELIWDLVSWLPWAFFAPFIFYLAEHFRFKSYKLIVIVIVHASAAVLLSIIQPVSYGILNDLYGNFNHEWNVKTVFSLSLNLMHVKLLVYLFILGTFFLLDYYRKFREREVRSLRLENQLAEARLEVLKIQLHPHFLFNTLHAISALIPDDPDAADRMIGLLSDLLRLTLESSKKQEVPLKEELDFLSLYLEIEEIRFQDRLKVEINVSPGMFDILVPGMLLQPLIENAIRHGISPKAEGGKVEINVRGINENVLIEIIDNGIGLKEAGSSSIKKGFGISNTKERLEQLYGENFSLEIKNTDSGGCIVTLEIPYRISGEESKSIEDNE
ncbi:sensor histidine kinase [candidate division KSB1 bacterium]